MESKGIKLSDYATHETNPYVKGLIVPKRKKTVVLATDKNYTIFDNDSGEEKTAFIATREEIDNEKYVKIFKEQLRIIFNLSQAGIRVLGYFMDATKISDDIVVFNIDKCTAYTEYKSKEPIYRGLKELLDNDIIARTSESNLYFINPTVFFNGDRLILVKEYVKKSTNKQDFTEHRNSSLLELNNKSENPTEEINSIPETPKGI